MRFCLWRNVMTDVKETMTHIEDGAKHLASGPGDYQIKLDLNPKNLYVDFNSLGANGNTKTFEGYSPRLEKAAHGKPSMSDRVASLINTVKAPFKPKKVHFVNTNKGNSGR